MGVAATLPELSEWTLALLFLKLIDCKNVICQINSDDHNLQKIEVFLI